MSAPSKSTGRVLEPSPSLSGENIPQKLNEKPCHTSSWSNNKRQLTSNSVAPESNQVGASHRDSVRCRRNGLGIFYGYSNICGRCCGCGGSRNNGRCRSTNNLPTRNLDYRQTGCRNSAINDQSLVDHGRQTITPKHVLEYDVLEIVADGSPMLTHRLCKLKRGRRKKSLDAAEQNIQLTR